MALFRNIRVASWPVMAGVGVLVIAAWGIYAWRFTGSTPAQADRSAVVSNADKSSRTDAASNAGMTPLRATRPSAGASDRVSHVDSATAGDNAQLGDAGALNDAMSREALSVSIAVNAPPPPNQAIEMTFGHVEPPLSNTSALQGLQAGRAALARGDLLGARAALSTTLDHRLPDSEMRFARRELEHIADALLFSRGPIPGDSLTSAHVVNSGETLNTIAQHYKVTGALLAAINGISDPNRIYAGARLKVIHGPFRAVIHKADHRLDVYLGDIFVKSFNVGLGTNGGTPIGTWIVSDKLKNPAWTDPATARHYFADDPENPIGERWIGLHGIAGECVGRTGFGIHGTVDPASIGENFSVGCVRLLSEDAAFLYDLLVNQHSRVIIK